MGSKFNSKSKVENDDSSSKRSASKTKITKKVNAAHICSKCLGNKTEGRKCDWCNVFECEHHLVNGAFCRGKCQRYGCTECVTAGALQKCTKRSDCTEMICLRCETCCENYWDYMAIRGVVTEDIMRAMKSGGFQQYIDAAEDFY